MLHFFFFSFKVRNKDVTEVDMMQIQSGRIDIDDHRDVKDRNIDPCDEILQMIDMLMEVFVFFRWKICQQRDETQEVGSDSESMS